ncbi:endonuclease/exonuclease/phosphatase family protein [Sphingomonas sp. RS2018]
MTAAAPATRLKVASYNMRKAIGTDRRRRPERTIEVLNEIDADIIALQECDRRFGQRAGVISPHLLEEHTRWRAVSLAMRPGSMGWHGNALLVPKDSTIAACAAIHLPALEPRGAVMADVTIGEVTLRTVGMHLDLSGLWRRRQAAAIMGHVDGCAPPHPCVLMGDLNEWTRHAGCLRDFARDYESAETGPSFHTRRPVARLDRIMVSNGIRIVDCGVHASLAARTASDHLPIWASIDVG